jgi:hypothetical protein
MEKKILSFDQFEKVYEQQYFFNNEIEEAEDAAPAEDATAAPVVDPSTGEPTDDIADLKDAFKELAVQDKKDGGDKVAESQMFEAKPNTLKPAKVGETSDRVKDIQKMLGLEETGKFDMDLQVAVEKFQEEQQKKDPSVVVDGIVGNQTYGRLLKIKGGIKDKTEIDQKKTEFAKAGAAVSGDAVKNIIFDPRLHELYESVTIVKIGNETRIICIPKSDIATKIESLKASGILTASFDFVVAGAEAVGKALVYTVVGAVIIPLEIAKAMINGAISATKFVAKGIMAVVVPVAHGLAQVAKWTAAKGKEIYAKVTTGAEDVWKYFVANATKALATSKEGILSFCSAANHFLGKAQEAGKTVLLAAVGTLAVAAELGWKGIKSLGGAVKAGWNKVASVAADAAKKIKETIQSGYTAVKTTLQNAGNAVLNGMQKAKDSVKSAIKSGVQSAGSALVAAGNWLKGMFESLFNETGDPIFEALIAD